jgi:hypothetical protein
LSEIREELEESYIPYSVDDSLSIVERDAAIQRFEYTFEAVWKAGNLFLRQAKNEVDFIWQENK